MIRIVFLGEFDCGKSTLIGRLLFDTDSVSRETKEEFLKIKREQNKEFEFAYLLDSFEEERKRELTIDTTQAFLKTQGKEYLLIDVPGHEELLENMLTGTSYADSAIIICDIEKLLETQTKRHAYLLKFLGINNFILAINKMDKVNFSKDDFNKISVLISDFLKQIGFGPKYIIPVSARTGENVVNKSEKMPWYRGHTLIEEINNLCITSNKFTDFRFPIQDIYSKHKRQIVIGTAVSGAAKVGDKIKIAPQCLEAKINEMVVFGKTKLEVRANESVGLILDRENGLKRGQVIYKELIPRVANQFWAKIFCIQNLIDTEELVFKCSTQDVPCRIIKIKEVLDTATLETMSSPNVLRQTNTAEVLIETNEPVVIEKFKEINSLGRFILHKEEKVFAVGVIP